MSGDNIMDKTQLINEISAEIDYPNEQKKRELVELFVTVMLTKTEVSELAGVIDRQFSAYLKLFDQEAKLSDIKLCLSDALKLNPF